MTKLHSRLFVLGAAMIAAGCAQQPVKPTADAPAAAPSAAATATAPAHASWAGISKPVMRMARDNGYRPELRDGKTFFCRHETPIDSMIPRTTCVDATNLRWQVQYERQERQRLQQGEPEIGQPGTG